ncbi:hypothetical protein [Thermoflavimicrobium dichotomicum]|uniref:Uncharacterized protein n=1 Tax=Thermoflavimicrobium dichotomicum TaxID=46223 RepID=A0A1I3RZY5_9BACL|nr:hypothetical protein [Thermoflavimicrobium dichotomicum]SFJ50847.1 hypothetical protein SAMN05421852_11164 [Thermoflavimicrobium dichotomicum]
MKPTLWGFGWFHPKDDEKTGCGWLHSRPGENFGFDWSLVGTGAQDQQEKIQWSNSPFSMLGAPRRCECCGQVY